MKRISKYFAVQCLWVLLSLTCFSIETSAQNKKEADSFYKAEKYDKAVAQYEALLKKYGSSSVLYYNLGNAYYKTEQIPQAILAYERALLLDPANKDARFNLELARQKTVDKQATSSDMFFVTWWYQLSSLMSPQGWAILGISTFVMMLIGILFYAFFSSLKLRKCGIYGALGLFVICIFSNLFLLTQWRNLHSRDAAIVMSPAVVVKSSPGENSTDLFLIHAGTRLRILDDSMREWREVEVEEGKQGWVHLHDIEII